MVSGHLPVGLWAYRIDTEHDPAYPHGFGRDARYRFRDIKGAGFDSNPSLTRFLVAHPLRYLRMAHFIIGCFAGSQQVRHAEEQLLTAGFSRDQLERPVAQTDSPEQSAGEEVSGLQSFVTSISGEPPPAAIIPDDLIAASALSVDIRVQVTNSAEAVQAENILRQAGARTVTKAD